MEGSTKLGFSFTSYCEIYKLDEHSRINMGGYFREIPTLGDTMT